MCLLAVEFGSVGDTLNEIALGVIRSISKGNYLLHSAILYFGFIFLEWIAYVKLRKSYNYKEAGTNILNQLIVEIGNAVIVGTGFFVIYIYVYNNMRLITLSTSVAGFLITFLLNDFVHYVDHRMQHRIGLLWAIHTAHHSSQEMNVLIANRGTLLQLGMLTAPAYLILPLCGANPQIFLVVFFLGNAWGILSHTEIIKRLGLLENVLITPSNHRVHHGNQKHYLDKNYGQVLLIWDKLFGTYQRETEPPIYGLVDQLEKQTVWNIQTAGLQRLLKNLRATKGLSAKLRVLIAPPGS